MANAPSVEQQIAFLSHELERAKVRFERWLVTCCVFSIGVSLLAVLTKSVLFAVIAGFGWFFVWNRWKCWAFVSALSSAPAPSNQEERTHWLSVVTGAVLQPPLWWNRSENVSGATLIALFAVVTFFVVGSSGFWMKVLYAIAWGVLVLYIARKVKYARAIRKNSMHTAAGDNSSLH